jgi:hypothetical protein
MSCGRRWGKSTFARREAIKWTSRHKNGFCIYLVPAYEMARQAFDRIQMELGPMLASSRLSSLSITLKNGAEIKVCCMCESWIRGYNQKPGFIIVDEAGEIHDIYCEPALRAISAGSEALIIGTPKGLNWFYRMFTNERGEYEVSRHPSSERVPLEEIEHARHAISPGMFEQEFLAEFVKEADRA